MRPERALPGIVAAYAASAVLMAVGSQAADAAAARR